jgi:DNA mismatch endonuclease (patch repair protein)
MADVFSKKKRSQVMAAIRSKGNKATELKLISIFQANRITGWRRNQKLPGKPDFVFRPKRLVVFVDGCFWHGCQSHWRIPKSNQIYWRKKIGRNLIRDHATNRLLRKMGWQVVRLWEHSLRMPNSVARRVKSLLNERRPF